MGRRAAPARWVVLRARPHRQSHERFRVAPARQTAPGLRLYDLLCLRSWFQDRGLYAGCPSLSSLAEARALIFPGEPARHFLVTAPEVSIRPAAAAAVTISPAAGAAVAP